MKRNIFVTNGGMEKEISDFLGNEVENILLVPYAVSKGAYNFCLQDAKKGFEPLGLSVNSIHNYEDSREAIEEADSVMITGGNTYVLLQKLYEEGILEVLRKRGLEGMPIIGKSAGAGVLCPTIKTTNDWAVVQVPSLDAIGVLPFQINPHFPFAGSEERESRIERIQEFLRYNRGTLVLGLREGSSLIVRDDDLIVDGYHNKIILVRDEFPEEIPTGTKLEGFLKKD